jgi:transcription elongation factor SPT5
MSPGLHHATGGGGADAMDHKLLRDLLVNVAAENEPPRIGVVRAVDASSGICDVKLGNVMDDGSFEADEAALEVRVHAGDVLLVVPQKKNAVKIVRGEHRGQMGSLIGVDVADGIVKLDETGDIKIIEMISLGCLIKSS